jgi:transposase
VIVDPLTGEARQAQIFVAVMGASNFAYVEATWTQTPPDWIGARTRAFPTLPSRRRRLIPLTQVRLYVVGASIPPGSHFCVDCLA